jgi:thiamine biosynthesis lipoprotein
MTTQSQVVHLMGTIITIQITHNEPAPLLTQVVQQLQSFERRFNANTLDSELGQVNQQAGIAPVVVDPVLYHLIEIGVQASLPAQDNLNIALGPLVQTWRIGFQDAHVPTKAAIQQALALSDPRDIVLVPAQHSVFLKKPGMWLDLGSLAKGYFADLIAQFLKDHNVQAALINLGGNVVVFGPNPQRKTGQWQIGIQDPTRTRGHYRLIVPVQNRSVVTSGIYERHLTQNGHDYHHILDRRTGYPIETDVTSLTILSDRSLDGELWTTRLFGAPRNQIMGTLAVTPGIDGIVMTKDGRVTTTLPSTAYHLL